jgi:DNA-binding SARP family transcriptional activator
MEMLADLVLRTGSADAPLADLARWVHDNPYNERLHGQLALALHGAGRTAEALQLLRDLRWRLEAELGVMPGSFARQVEHDVRASQPEDDGAALTASSEPTLASQHRRLLATIRELQEVVTALAACARSLDHLDLA